MRKAGHRFTGKVHRPAVGVSRRLVKAGDANAQQHAGNRPVAVVWFAHGSNFVAGLISGNAAGHMAVNHGD